MSATSEFDPAAPAAAAGTRRRRDLMEQFGRRKPLSHSRAYSRFVSMMKFLLPAVALLLILVLIAWPHLNTSNLRFKIGFAALQISGSKEPNMINPRYVGTDKDNQPFSITADIARNLGSDESQIELEMPKADITTKEGSWLVLTSETGVFAKTENKLNLSGKVNFFHDSGYEFHTERAVIDLHTGAASGDDPVDGQGPFGHITADGFRLIDRGRIIHFKGKSKLTIYPGAGRAGK